MKCLKGSFITVSIIFLIAFSGISNVNAQSSKKILNVEDVELWRNNSVTISDDGNWYTVLYSLSERPEQNNDSTKGKKDKEDEDEEIMMDNQEAVQSSDLPNEVKQQLRFLLVLLSLQ